MKAIVMSDSHRSFRSIRQIMEIEKTCDYLIHAGDVQRDIEEIESVWPRLPLIYVLGNNDFCMSQLIPYDRNFVLEGKRFFLTHGHRYHVKSSLLSLTYAAESHQAEGCIFGHTHQPYLEQVRGIWLMNPGSTQRSYGVITIEKGELHLELKRI